MTGFALVAGDVPYLHHTATADRARHGFFGTAGGVSSGVYESLNCGFGSHDDTALVTANRDRAASAMGLKNSRLAATYQVHGADTVVISDGAPTDRNLMNRADGMVTTQPGLGLSILTADCLPLLMVDDTARVIGACHAGWRGAVAGIVPATLNLMRENGAGPITALMGPAIRQPSYQVGAEMREACLATVVPELREAAASCFLAEDHGRFRFDLPALVWHQLTFGGAAEIHDCLMDTYPADTDNRQADSPGFFSHRRATHAEDPDCGRQISIIALAD